jgi:tRNA threonylcarbamoyladenosine biosynthesis protein TsaE
MERAVRALKRLLADPAATALFGKALAEAVSSCNPGALLLYGCLGAGKTTLTRALVSSLAGGGQAEVSSPSFTTCNIYSTAPPVHHFDLYRLDSGSADEALEESLDDPSVLSIVEWSERLSPLAVPADGLVLRLTPGPEEDSRQAECTALGHLGEQCLLLLHATTPQ